MTESTILVHNRYTNIELKGHPVIDEEAQDRLVAALEEAARHCGLYLRGATVIRPGDDDDPSIPEDRPVLFMAGFDVGDLAFSTRVLDPGAEQTNVEFREIIVDDNRDTVERLKREGMTGALAELEDEGEA